MLFFCKNELGIVGIIDFEALNFTSLDAVGALRIIMSLVF